MTYQPFPVGGKLRQQIAWEAAQIVFGHQDVDLGRARLKAARRLCRGRIRPQDMPHDAEIRAQLRLLVLGFDGQPTRESEVQGPSWAECRDYFETLLLPLEHVRDPLDAHPEGDVLYHSLQVFSLAQIASPFDEELLLAALLHEVGKGIDPRHAQHATVEALEAFVSPRTLWLITHMQDGFALLDGTAGVRMAKRIRHSSDHEDLLLLCRCDRRGRRMGAVVPDVDEALDAITKVREMCGD